MTNKIIFNPLLLIIFSMSLFSCEKKSPPSPTSTPESLTYSPILIYDSNDITLTLEDTKTDEEILELTEYFLESYDLVFFRKIINKNLSVHFSYDEANNQFRKIDLNGRYSTKFYPGDIHQISVNGKDFYISVYKIKNPIGIGGVTIVISGFE